MSGPIDGAVGVAAPADAPREVSAGLTAAERAIPAAARGNERELAPLRYTDAVATDPVGPGVKAATHEVQVPPPVVAAPGYQQTPRREDPFPAASNSDGPSRGIPGTAPVPAGRKNAPLSVTGGFGQMEAEYFPLDGREALTLANHLLDELHARIQNDLRFSVAATYPRLSMRIQLIIEGEADDQAFTIEKVLPPHTQTPLEVARAHGDSVVFVVTAQRREFDEAGNVETPSDAMRDELALRKPGKRSVKNGLGTALVDVLW